MKINLIPSLVFLGSTFPSLFAAGAMSEYNAEMVNKYHLGAFYIDGVKVSNPNEVTLLHIDNKKKLIERKLDENNLYRMTWGEETLKGSPVLTMTEVSTTPLGKNSTVVYSRTSTFSATKLRSSTICHGNTQTQLGMMKTSMKCVTATKSSCKRLMEAYVQETGKNDPPKVGTQASLSPELATSVLKNYENMVRAVGNQPDPSEPRHEEVVKEDTARVKASVDQATGSKIWDPTNIGSVTKSSDIDEMAKGYVSSIEGMQTLTSALQLCADASADFAEGARS
ncbi:MAG: hypothetical protein ACXWRE_10305, partial [Pseudobdellovibrionaceae bacterium]